MDRLPLPIICFFLLTTLLAFIGFSKAVRHSRIVLGISALWICLQSIASLSGFYLDTRTLPPHFIIAIAPPIFVIAAVFATVHGRRFVDGMDLKWCVLIHTVRIFVELNLYWLFLYRQVPAEMTFEAGNLDVLVGLTAPLIWWAFRNGYAGKRGLLIWNCFALLGVLNAFGRAMLSAPFRFQQFAFSQPTVAILYFPFVLLAAFIVPAVIFCHLALFRKLSVPAIISNGT
jgi:hypothetical protein